MIDFSRWPAYPVLIGIRNSEEYGIEIKNIQNRAHSYLYLGIQVILLCFIGDALDSSKTVEKSDEIMFRHILLTAWALKGIASMP